MNTFTLLDLISDTSHPAQIYPTLLYQKQDEPPPRANASKNDRLLSLRRKEALVKADITHVLSALSLPLDPHLFANYKHHVVEVDDVDDDNILEHFHASNAFIQQGLDGGRGVLVHW